MGPRVTGGGGLGRGCAWLEKLDLDGVYVKKICGSFAKTVAATISQRGKACRTEELAMTMQGQTGVVNHSCFWVIGSLGRSIKAQGLPAVKPTAKKEAWAKKAGAQPDQKLATAETKQKHSTKDGERGPGEEN